MLLLADTSSPEKKNHPVSHMIVLFIKYKNIRKTIILINNRQLDSLNYISERIFYQIFLLLCCGPVNPQCEQQH